MSVEGGIRGTQHPIVCPNCGKTFSAWRPDTQPGARIKCYFCRHEFEDDAARRPPVAAAAPAAAESSDSPPPDPASPPS